MLKYATLFLFLVALPVSALAEQHISIAVSNTTSDGGPGALGVGVGDTAAAADETAMNTCRSYHGTSCQIVEQQVGGCVALAKASGAAHDGVGSAKTEKSAIEAALKNCSDGGKYAVCSVTHNACYD